MSASRWGIGAEGEAAGDCPDYDYDDDEAAWMDYLSHRAEYEAENEPPSATPTPRSNAEGGENPNSSPPQAPETSQERFGGGPSKR